jgi:hypothetical protein
LLTSWIKYDLTPALSRGEGEMAVEFDVNIELDIAVNGKHD